MTDADIRFEAKRIAAEHFAELETACRETGYDIIDALREVGLSGYGTWPHLPGIKTLAKLRLMTQRVRTRMEAKC